MYEIKNCYKNISSVRTFYLKNNTGSLWSLYIQPKSVWTQFNGKKDGAKKENLSKKYILRIWNIKIKFKGIIS